MSNWAFKSASCDCNCAPVLCTVPCNTMFFRKTFSSTVRQWGFPGFLNAHEWVSKTDGSHPARHGFSAGIALQFPDVNSDAVSARRQVFGGASLGWQDVNVDERPVLSPGEVVAHPELGLIIARHYFTGSAWRESDRRPVRTERWTGGFWSHTAGQVIRRRTGPGAGTLYEATRGTNAPVGGVLGDQGQDPADLSDWWRVRSGSVADSGVRSSYIVGSFDDDPDWGTLGDYKFSVVNGSVRFYVVTTEGRIVNPESDGTHLSALDWGALTGQTMPAWMGATIGKEWVEGTGWRNSTLLATAFAQLSPNGSASTVPAGAVVRRLAFGNVVTFYRALVDVDTTAVGDPSGSGSFQFLQRFVLPLEDMNIPEPQPIEAIATNPPFLNRQDDFALPDRFLTFRARSRLVDVWGYPEGLSSIAGGEWEHVAEYSIDPATGAGSVAQFDAVPAVHPLSDPAGVAVGGVQAGKLLVYDYVDPTKDYREWDGDRPKWMRAGDWLEVEYWSDFSLDDVTPNPTGEVRKRWTWRFYAVGGIHFPMPVNLPIAVTLPIDRGGIESFYYIMTDRHYDNGSGVASFPLPVIDWTVTDLRSLDEVKNSIYPLLPGAIDSFHSEPSGLTIRTLAPVTSWCEVTLWLDGVAEMTVAQSPMVVGVIELEVEGLNSRGDVLAAAHAAADAVDFAALPWVGWGYNQPGSLQFVPERVNGSRAGTNFAVVTRGAFRFSNFWSWRKTVLDSDGVTTCEDADAVVPPSPYTVPTLDRISDPRGGALDLWNIQVPPPCTGYDPRRGFPPPNVTVYSPPVYEGGEVGSGFEWVTVTFNQVCV